ncbi:CoA ester lyase [Rhodococcus opacus]|nr:CoA ester lyase [Rhodococcus opacus]
MTRPAPLQPQLVRRSALFVPAHVERFVVSAPRAGADAIVLDLEDSVPTAERGRARSALRSAASYLAPHADVLVRVNSGPDLEDDLRAVAAAGVGEVLLPKVSSPADVRAYCAAADVLCRTAELSILVESAAGVVNLGEILTVTPIRTVALGVEDLRSVLEMHAPRSAVSDTLLHAHAQLVLTALAHDVIPLGTLASIGLIDEVTEFNEGALKAFRLGYRGSYCVHPMQVPLLHQAFVPSPKDVRWARAVACGALAARRDGRGAFRVDGAMVDAPMIERADRILAAATTVGDHHAQESNPTTESARRVI